MSPEERDRLDYKVRFLVPGLGDVLGRFRLAFPELSTSSLGRIFRLGVEAGHRGGPGTHCCPEEAHSEAFSQVADGGKEQE